MVYLALEKNRPQRKFRRKQDQVTITNKFGLPQPLVKMLDRHPYSRGKAHISVTELISPPQIAVLRREHNHEIVEDVADRFWALMGTNIHKILEDAADADHVPEERLFVTVNGWVVSGQIDLQKHGDGTLGISDWKFTSVYNVMHPKPEWDRQLNLYAHLVELTKGVQVTGAHVVALLRDWKKSDGKRFNNYPLAPVAMVPIEIWPFETRQAYLEARVVAHQNAVRSNDWHGQLPPCSPEDRWVRKDSEPGIRCVNDYCNVASFCSQWRSENESRQRSLSTETDKLLGQHFRPEHNAVPKQRAKRKSKIKGTIT